jgi:hypothetical protein
MKARLPSPSFRARKSRARPLSLGILALVEGLVLGSGALTAGCPESIPPYALSGDASPDSDDVVENRVSTDAASDALGDAELRDHAADAGDDEGFAPD